MKAKDESKVRKSLMALVYVTILALAVGILAGCEEAGASGGDDSTADGSGSDTTPGDDDTIGDGGTGEDGTTGGDGGIETLDTGAMVLHLGFEGNLNDETGTSSSMTVFDVGGGTPAAVYGEDRDAGENGAIEFDGSYAMKVEDIDLSSFDSITVTAWIRDDGSATETKRWIAAYASSGSYYEFAMTIRELAEASWQDGSFEAFVENNGSNGTRTVENVFPGSWVHVAMVYDGDAGELRLYQDGNHKNTTSVSLDIGSGNLIIGGGNGSNTDFHGRIDDLAIFTRALSDEEVALAKDQIGTN